MPRDYKKVEIDKPNSIVDSVLKSTAALYFTENLLRHHKIKLV
jgi:hypothetical protein